jgi:hypothetical protein
MDFTDARVRLNAVTLLLATVTKVFATRMVVISRTSEWVTKHTTEKERQLIPPSLSPLLLSSLLKETLQPELSKKFVVSTFKAEKFTKTQKRNSVACLVDLTTQLLTRFAQLRKLCLETRINSKHWEEWQRWVLP